ncbi:MAG: phosphoenolpyruvate synthase [SAR202 cluster bacterium]|nr:phosphoenolpyruvate synthase [SAR202 cluster bacterium]
MLREKYTDLAQATDRAIVVYFGEVGKDDVDIAGGKGASLGEMTRAGFPVPPGFVVTTSAFKEFMERNRLYEAIDGLIPKSAGANLSELQRAALQIQNIITSAPMTMQVMREVEEAYRRIGEGTVAVRSSATAEDGEDASFAGQQRTFLHVEGIKDVIKAIQGCWASLFEARAIFYRETNGFRHDDVSIAVPVQQMVSSDVSGVMFTVHPTTNDRSHMVIEAIYGLGEPLVSGELSPDTYVLERGSQRIVDRQIAEQSWKMCRGRRQNGYSNGTEHEEIPVELQKRQKLNDIMLARLAILGLKLEKHYGSPQDVEWVLHNGHLYVLQSRPITTLQSTNGHVAPADHETDIEAVISGSPASPGVVSGPVRIIHSADDIDKVMTGDVLVTEMTTPDFVPAMKRAAGIVTDRGGRTCHAAIVSREMGIPCIVGAGAATKVLTNGAIVTINGRTGKVYAGDVTAQLKTNSPAKTGQKLKTRTRFYVNLADPDAAERVASMHVDGVGLLRAEFMMAHIGEHPRAKLDSGRRGEYVDRLAEGLEKFASAFGERPVVYRFSDFKTDEYRNLKGGQQYEPHEDNPIIGYRGCSRYLQEPDLLEMEVEAIKRVRALHKNLWVMLPFVRTLDEMKGVKDLLDKFGLPRQENFKLWMMCEVPSNVILLEEFLDLGVDGVSIGSNDLTQLILGVDRNSEKPTSTFDECNPAVMRAMERVVKVCKSRGVTVSICGQAPSVYPEFVKALISWGITFVSVTPDMVDETRETTYKVENQL